MNNNTLKFDSVISAANKLSIPFTINIAPGTSNNYSYETFSMEDMQQNLGISDEVWQFGGPIIGLNLIKNCYQASIDCSGFVSAVLNTVYLNNQTKSIYNKLVMVNNALTNYSTPQHPQPFPSAKDFAELFTESSNANWKFIAFSNAASKVTSGAVNQAQAGDILAYSLPEGSQDTGHVMIIQSVTPLKKGTLNPDNWGSDLTEFTDQNLTFFSVSVFDSSNVPHYHDVRGSVTAGKTGVGLGKILLIGDSTGSPIGFMFNIHDRLLITEPIATDIQSSQITNLEIIAIGRAI